MNVRQSAGFVAETAVFRVGTAVFRLTHSFANRSFGPGNAIIFLTGFEYGVPHENQSPCLARSVFTKNRGKTWRLPNEEREILLSNPRIRRVGKGQRHQEEHLYVAYGETQVGRYLTIFFIHKAGNEALIISARDMDNKERKQYGRK